MGGADADAQPDGSVGSVRAEWPWLSELALFALVGLVHIGGTALAAQHQDVARSLDRVGVGLLSLGLVGLPLRRRSPEGALALALASTGTYWALGFPRGPVFLVLIVTFGATVVAGRRAAAVASLVVGFVVFTFGRDLLGRGDPPSLAGGVGLAAWLITLLSIAEVVRARGERAREAQRSGDEALRRQAADERVRIARELHDAVAHNMSMINIQAGVALHLMDGGDPEAAEALRTIKEASKEALVELRSILGVLRAVDEESPRTPTPSLARIDELVATAAKSGVDVHLDVDMDAGPLPRPVDLAAYRIIQESLTNVARHSDRPEAVVRVRAAAGVLTVEVLDEGTGRASTRDIPSGGNGIAGMRERAASVGGELSAGARPGQGFAVTARLPLEDRS